MKKGLKTALIILIVIVLIGCAIGGYFIYRHNTLYISKTEAFEYALNDAGLQSASVVDVDIDFENSRYTDAYYDVEFKANGNKYDYMISATTGEILSSRIK